MEFFKEHKRRAAYSGGSKVKYCAVGDSGRSYDIEQTLEGWRLEVHNRDFFVVGFIFQQVLKAKKAADELERGKFDPASAPRTIRGPICFECGGETPPEEAACRSCGTLKPWIDRNS